MEVRSVEFIIPCLNESETIRKTYERLSAVADAAPSRRWSFLFVNDGSTDGTGDILNYFASQDPRVRVLHLACRRGHQNAVTAGLDYADADAVIIIDADLQDPPELAPEMIEKIEQGNDVVHAQRRARAKESWFKIATAKVFYRVLRYLSKTEIIPDCGDFRAISRPVLEAVRGFREPHRFLRGLFAAIGFKSCIVQYDRAPRLAGETKYPLTKMVRLAFDAVFGFSSTPVRLIVWLTCLSWLVSLIFTCQALYSRFVLGGNVPGWTSLLVFLSLYTGLMLFSIAIVGAYVARIFEQGQGRPLYWLRDARNVSSPSAPRAPVSREVDLSARIVNPSRAAQAGDESDRPHA